MLQMYQQPQRGVQQFWACCACVHKFTPPTVPSAHFVQNDRPRPHYCFVHVYKVSHDGPACRVMESDPLSLCMVSLYACNGRKEKE